MRIAYIAPYQGPSFFKDRPSLYNLGLAANVKIELITELLLQNGNEIEVISPGEVAERQLKIFPFLAELQPFHEDVKIHYASALPVKYITGLWSGFRTLAVLKERHRSSPFDLVIIYNLGPAQIRCASYVVHRLKLPLVLEYEDDAFVDVNGKIANGLRAWWRFRLTRRALGLISGGMAVSPYLLGQMPALVPKLLLRGVVSNYIEEASKQTKRNNWVVYSGTHTPNKGLEQLITAWSALALPDWELHIAGKGEITTLLEHMAEGNKTIVFHGLLNQRENAHFLSKAKIGINPHNVSNTPGNVFAFKIIEYLAAGVHCITTPMGDLEPELEAALTYMLDNSPATIATTLQELINNRRYERLASQAALDTYGPYAVVKSLEQLLQRVRSARVVAADN